MTFADAMAEILVLFPDHFVSFNYTVDRDRQGKITIKAGCITVAQPLPGQSTTAISFYHETWRGVIDKAKIHLMPKGEADIAEAPEEVICPTEPSPNSKSESETLLNTSSTADAAALK